MLPSARAPWPLLLSSILGAIALCLFMYSLKTPAVSTAPVAWGLRPAQSVSRRLPEADPQGTAEPSQSSSEPSDPPRSTSAAPAAEKNIAEADGGELLASETAAAHANTAAAVTTTPADNNDSSSSSSSGGGSDTTCFIFQHLQKSGGSTVKKMLADTYGSRYFVYDTMRWKFGDDFLGTFGAKLARGDPWNVMAGGYTEALRRSPAVAASCRFFTVFRHPISRLVSAYFYCQVYEGDTACASNVVRARDVDLVGFAEHWSNFAVRQFALSMVPADDVMAYARTPEAGALLPESIESVDDVSGWYLLKMYLKRVEAGDTDREVVSGDEQPRWETTAVTTRGTGQAAEEGEREEESDVPDAEMYGFLEPAKALLSDHYAVVGVLEEWNTTLSLFDAALGMTKMDWRHEFLQEGRQNVDVRFLKLKAETLEKAWTDEELKKYLRLDLLLYEYAVDLFHQQARSHGLDVSE